MWIGPYINCCSILLKYLNSKLSNFKPVLWTIWGLDATLKNYPVSRDGSLLLGCHSCHILLCWKYQSVIFIEHVLWVHRPSPVSRSIIRWLVLIGELHFKPEKGQWVLKKLPCHVTCEHLSAFLRGLIKGCFVRKKSKRSRTPELLLIVFRQNNINFI